MNVTTGDTSNVEGTAHLCHHQYDESGAVQYTITAGTATEVELQGRLTSAQAWIEIATSGALNSAGTADILQTGIAILPEMRAVLKGPSSGAAVKVYLME
ncbi:MAG: hypothetical protein Unbinned5784contig1000_38 [Prokaryotic dsDNA virus sp.]|nr:MAG: hypothetical protein Unbinned5784contig1000_38 [Prokaryotic dsDNA virus sp.]|tara:strand:+ start:2884 stop:3183 length:300 start_codon:yes stop_codon:yes gene_type:complete